MVHLPWRTRRGISREVRSSSNIDRALDLEASDGKVVPNTEPTAEDTAAEPVSAMSLKTPEAGDGTLNGKSSVNPKAGRFWKFINSLVPKMLDSDSEDEEDDPAGLEKLSQSEPTCAEEQEDGDSILSELAFGPLLHGGAKDALKGFNEGCDDMVEETREGCEADCPQLLTDRRSQRPKITTRQRGVNGRTHDAEEATTSGDDSSNLDSLAFKPRASRSSHFGVSATTGLLVQAYQKDENVGGHEASKVASMSSIDSVGDEHYIASSSSAEIHPINLLSHSIDQASSSAESQSEVPISHATVSLQAARVARTKAQPPKEQPLEAVPVSTETEIDPPEVVTCDGPSKQPLGSEDCTGDEPLPSQPRLTELTKELHDGVNILSSKIEDVGTAKNVRLPITLNMQARVKAGLLRNDVRIHPAIIEKLLDDTSLTSWQKAALAGGMNPFANTGNLRYVCSGLEETWTRHGTATILPFDATSGLCPTNPDPNQKSLFHKLPPELREKVYHHVFQLRDKHGLHGKSHMQGHIETALLQTCRSIYFEARCMPLQANEFQFQESMYAGFFIDRLSGPQQRCLRYLLVRSGTMDFYTHRLKMWEDLFNALFGLYACGMRLRTLTVVIAGTWDVEIERMIEARWELLQNALHYIDDFYFSIEDPEVSYEIKAALHTKWATFFTGHAKDWPPLGLIDTSPIGTTFLPAPDPEFDGPDSSNTSLAEDPTITDGHSDEVEPSTDAVAEASHDHAATTEVGSANNLPPDPSVVNANAEDSAGSSDDDDDNEVQSNLSNTSTSKITENFNDEQPSHSIPPPSPNPTQHPLPANPPNQHFLTSTNPENKTPTTSTSTPAPSKHYPKYIIPMLLPNRPTKPFPPPRPSTKPQRLHLRLEPRAMPCPLLDRLTPALRARIFSFVFQIQGQEPAWKPRWFQGRIDTGLLYANRQMWKEARLMPAGVNEFTFACPSHARCFLNSIPPTLHGSVKRLGVFTIAEAFRWEYGRGAWTRFFGVVEGLQRGKVLLESLTVVVRGEVGSAGLGGDMSDAWGGLCRDMSDTWKDLGGTLFPLGEFGLVFEDERVGEGVRRKWEGRWGRWLVSGYADCDDDGAVGGGIGGMRGEEGEQGMLVSGVGGGETRLEVFGAGGVEDFF